MFKYIKICLKFINMNVLFSRLALIICQKLLLYLGDLARYKEQVNSTSNYGRARQYYQKANHLDMRNGRPFNMLAILAKLSNRKFEAVYYNIRLINSLICLKRRCVLYNQIGFSQFKMRKKKYFSFTVTSELSHLGPRFQVKNRTIYLSKIIKVLDVPKPVHPIEQRRAQCHLR